MRTRLKSVADIVGLVAAIIKSELDAVGERTYMAPWLTETALRGGHGVWRFSWIVAKLCFALRSVHRREAVPAFNLHGTLCAMVGV
jgi:hypothetical protein